MDLLERIERLEKELQQCDDIHHAERLEMVLFELYSQVEDLED
jgi:hypothetical protein